MIDLDRTIQRQAFHSLPHLQKLELQHNLLQVGGGGGVLEHYCSLGPLPLDLYRERKYAQKYLQAYIG